jgi:serine/threonine protein kinase
MRQIIEGLKYIHSKKIIHRDLKLENILVNFKNEEDKKNLDLLKSEIKIIDFGLAIEVGPDGFASTTLGTPANMDPIIVKKFNKAGGFEKLQKYNAKADIWSIGTICYEMFTRETLFKAKDMNDLFLKSEKGNFSIPINKELSNEFISFINAMLQYDHNKRYSAEELSKHDFLIKKVNEFTKPNYDLMSHRISGNNLILGSKDNATVWAIFNKKDKEEKQKILDLKAYIDGLLDEYKAASNYFKQNNLIKQMENANNICLKIENIKKQFELGNNNDLISLPQPIDPQFIYGCSLSERNKKFKEIISKCLDDKNQLESKINSLDKNSFQSNNEIKKEYDNDIVELKKLNNNIKELQNKINHI